MDDRAANAFGSVANAVGKQLYIFRCSQCKFHTIAVKLTADVGWLVAFVLRCISEFSYPRSVAVSALVCRRRWCVLSGVTLAYTAALRTLSHASFFSEVATSLKGERLYIFWYVRSSFGFRMAKRVRCSREHAFASGFTIHFQLTGGQGYGVTNF